MKTIRWIIFGIFLVLLVGCGDKPAQVEPSSTAISDEVTAPTPTPVRTGVTILADGVVQAVQPLLPLAFETGGKLLSVHVGAGDVVQEGDLIATLDPASLAEAELNMIRAQRALDDIYANADLDAALALKAVDDAQKRLDETLDPELRLANATEAVARAETALYEAQLAFYGLVSDATSVDLEALQAEVAATRDAYLQAQVNFAPYANEWAEEEEEKEEKEKEGIVIEDEDKEPSRAENLHDLLIVAQYRYLQALNKYNAGSDVITAEAGLAEANQALIDVQRVPSQAEITLAEAQLAAARREWELLKDGPDLGKITLAESELSLAKDAVASINDQLTAPWTGTVMSVEAAPGSLVGGGTPIVTLRDMTQLEFHTTNLSERDFTQITPGQTAIVTLKAYPNDPIKAMVVRIGQQAEGVVGDAATFPVMLILNETDLDIRPGMTGRVEIIRDE
jgi:multidrug efflux pump subunit AcrA (membrane-fusion protein)